MKITLDKKKCIGCGACAACCPEVFEMKGGKANPKVKESNAPCVKQAAEGCPVKAITLK
jgi:ferredoxin